MDFLKRFFFKNTNKKCGGCKSKQQETIGEFVSELNLLKAKFNDLELDYIELENINATDKKRFSLADGVKIKSITNENLKPYEQDLIGNIILSIDNLKIKDIESASKILTNKGENQSIQMERRCSKQRRQSQNSFWCDCSRC